MTAGLLALVVGGIGLADAVGGLAELFLGLAAGGLLLLASAAVQYRLLRDARHLLDAVPQTMQLFTWPYRSIRSPVDNRVLVTLDLPGSVERTPLAEFTALGSRSGRTAGRSQDESPGWPAQVFGELRRGQAVLVIADDGSCFMGRISRTPRSDQAARHL